jgi:hypothetical protein
MERVFLLARLIMVALKMELDSITKEKITVTLVQLVISFSIDLMYIRKFDLLL